MQELTITVNIASNSPTLAGDTITLDKEALTALAENDGTGRVLISTASLRTLAEGWSETYGVKKRAVPVRVLRQRAGRRSTLTCDYKLDTDAAVKELLHQLLLRQPGEIDAPLNCYRNGKLFSIGDTYVEVDFDNQQLTFFKLWPDGAQFERRHR